MLSHDTGHSVPSRGSRGLRTPLRVGSGPAAPPHALAVGALAVLCLTTVLVVGVGWAVGNHQAVPTRDTPYAVVWQDQRSMVTTTEMEALRAEGWTLPTLSSAGYRVVDTAQGEMWGQPVAMITLEADAGRVHIIEQRGNVNPDNPVDGTTGLPVSAEGLSETVLAGSRLWVVRSHPWRAVMARQDVAYTVVSDTSPATLSRTLTLVAAEERGRVTLPGSEPSGFTETVMHGLRRIVG